MSDLSERLRRSLVTARCMPEARERLRELVDDESWLGPILEELGPGHAVVRELMVLTDRSL
jgi:hypothetical protein